MSRRILLLLFPLLFVVALSSHAQINGSDEFAWQDQYAPDYANPQPWVSDMDPNPRFPITVQRKTAVTLSQHHRRGMATTS